MDWSVGDAEGTDKALAEADVVVKERLVNQRLIPNPMEARGAAVSERPPASTRSGCPRRTRTSCGC